MITNGKTFELEKRIKERFSHCKSEVSGIRSEDLYPMMEGWLKTNIFSNYDIHTIEMVLAATGLSIAIQIDDIDDHKLIKCMSILGCPKDVYIGDDGKFYAHWIRNVISWF